jgi:hypothetical protein
MITAQELTAMLGADEISSVSSRDRTITLRSRDGQEVVVPAPGTTVTGLMMAVDDRLVLIKSDHRGTLLTVARATIAKAERMAGRRSRARYAAFGALLGLGVGSLAGFASVSCQPHEWFCSPGLAAGGGAIVGTTVGAVTGALIPPPARWIPIDPASLNPSSISLQQPAVSTQPSKRSRLAVSVQTGQPSSGPAQDVEAAMRVGGFADTSPGFGSPIDHPFSRTGFWEIGRPLAFELDYTWSPLWSVSFAASQTPIGETFGYSSKSSGVGYLDLQYRVTTAGVAVLRNYRFFRLGGGPALYTTQMRKDPAPEPDPAARNQSWASHSRVGLMGVVGIRLPTETRVYFDLSAQYRYVGRTPFGPFTPTSYGIPATPLTASEAQFSHWFIGFGPGIRF